MRRYENCNCPPSPQRPDMPLHVKHFKGGANFVPGVRKWHYVVAELAGCAAVLHGIGLWSAPSAWIVGGVAVVIAMEMRS